MTSDGGVLFTFPEKAHYWNDLYEHPASLFEHNMRLRCDYAASYIAARFDKSDRILDLGCGAGVLSERLLAQGYTVTAVDNSQDMLELSAKRLAPFPAQNYRLQQANCLDLPFADGQFDLVVSLGMFGYFDEVTQALNEIRRVLRPGGTLILSVRNAYTPLLFDLYELAKLPLRRLRRWLLPRAADTETVDRPPGDDGFRVEIYQAPGPLIDGVTRRGYALVEFDGFGFGPLRIANRQLLPVRISIGLSDFLNRFFRATRFNVCSRWFADVSIYVFRRNR